MSQPHSIHALTRSLTSLTLARQTIRPATRTLPTIRTLTTTTALQTKTLIAHKVPEGLVPAYPPGERRLYKQSNRGLYGEARIRFGHNVSGRNDTRTPRTWKPNTHRKKLWSDALGAWIKVKLTARVLRTVKKEGGLDAYLVGHGERRIRELGPAGWRLRWLVMQTPQVREKFAAERETLGLEARPKETRYARVIRREMVHVAMDYATPGPISRKTRKILENRGREIVETQEFEFGEAGGVLPDRRREARKEFEFYVVDEDTGEKMQLYGEQLAKAKAAAMEAANVSAEEAANESAEEAGEKAEKEAAEDAAEEAANESAKEAGGEGGKKATKEAAEKA